MKYLSLLIFAATLSGCAFWSDAKPVIKTVDDIAKDLCSIYYGKQLGVNPSEVVEKYCKTRDQWGPWIDPILASVEVGAGNKLPDVETPAAACPK